MGMTGFELSKPAVNHFPLAQASEMQASGSFNTGFKSLTKSSTGKAAFQILSECLWS